MIPNRKKLSLDKFLEEVASPCSHSYWGNFERCLGIIIFFGSSLNLTLGKFPVIGEPHPLGLNRDLSLLKNRRSGRLSPRASGVAWSYMDAKSEWYFWARLSLDMKVAFSKFASSARPV